MTHHSELVYSLRVCEPQHIVGHDHVVVLNVVVARRVIPHLQKPAVSFAKDGFMPAEAIEIDLASEEPVKNDHWLVVLFGLVLVVYVGQADFTVK